MVPGMSQLTLTLSGETTTIPMTHGESVLDAALRAGLDAPYSCMEGVCTACMAQIKDGEVDFPDDTILDDRDKAEGKTLTCQAKLKHGCEKLVIDYDAV